MKLHSSVTNASLRIVALLFFSFGAAACIGESNDAATEQPTADLAFAEEDQAVDEDQDGAATDSKAETPTGSGAESAESLPSIKVVRPKNGETVPQTFEVEVEVENFDLQPAGRSKAGEGHWHAILNQDCLEPGEVIPNGSSHFHAGDGSTTRTIQLEPGQHELCVQIGDGFHVAVNISETVTIIVR